jgi:hypothetical protein
MNSYKDFEELIFKYKGLIYGGYVRDKIINTEAVDIDVYFREKKDANLFKEKLADYGDILKIKTHNIGYAGLNRLLEFKNIEFKSNDKLFIFDISYPLEDMKDICHIQEPPFNNLDLLCNGFLLDKKGIRYSTTSGSYIDYLDDNDRQKEIKEIILDMYEYKTFINNNRIVKYEEPYLKMRIIKMMNKKPKWKILNASFLLFNTKIGKERCLCCDELINKKGVKINNKKYSINCFLFE